MTKKTGLLLLIPTVVVLSVACGDDDDDSVASGTSGSAGSAAGTTSNGGTAGTSAGAAGAAAGTGGSAGTTGGSGGSSTGRKSGNVVFSVLGVTEVAGLPTPVVYNSVAASFYDASGLPGSSGNCTTTDEGGCQLTTCTIDTGSSGAGGGPTAASAGDITISGGQVTPVVLSFAGEYKVTTPAPTTTNPQGVPGDKALFNGGETIEVKSTGGTVPTFSLSGKTPVSPTITGQPTSDTGTSEIQTGSDLDLTLAGGAEGIVEFVATSFSSSQSIRLFCSVPATASAIKVPASGLQKLKAVGTGGNFGVALSTTVTGKAGDWDVTLTMQNYLKGSDGKSVLVGGPVTYK